MSLRWKNFGQYLSYLMFNPVLFLAGTAYEKVISRFSALRYLRGWVLVVLERRLEPLPSTDQRP